MTPRPRRQSQNPPLRDLPPFRHDPGLQIPRLRYSRGLAPTTRLNALLNAASDSYRDGLRDIEACLRSLGGKLYHMGFRGRVARSTLADANDAHDWRIYADFAHVLIGIARPLYASDRCGSGSESVRAGLDHHRPVPFAVSLGQVSQAQSRRQNAHAAGPTWQHPHVYQYYRGKVHDVNILDEILPEAGAI
jgi:hypothetical protein